MTNPYIGLMIVFGIFGYPAAKLFVNWLDRRKRRDR